jgi:hypothetical protein
MIRLRNLLEVSCIRANRRNELPYRGLFFLKNARAMPEIGQPCHSGFRLTIGDRYSPNA